MPKSTKGGGSSGARGSTAGTVVRVRIGRVPVVGGNATAGESLAWNRPGVNAWRVGSFVGEIVVTVSDY
jgi:hypothetical protein